MKIDEAIFRTVMDCKDQFSSTKMISVLYYNLFNEWAFNTYDITNDIIVDSSRPWNDDKMEDYDDIDIDFEKFHEKISKLGYVRCELDYDDVYINTDKKVVCFLSTHLVKCVCNKPENAKEIKEIKSCIEVLEDDKTVAEIGILVQRNGNFYIEDTEIDIMNIDVNETYNDDIPVDAINDFVENERNGLMLFYGEPGTGKTTYIRHLIQEHENKRFIILDSNLLYNITSHSLINTFIDKKNAIYIIEDCEKLLVSRDNEPNPIIAAFLNMTDGILANIINCKFICTFNTDLSNVDEALKRKGRLKLKYEFKKLAANKVKKILNDDNANDMTIADVVYNEKQNDYSNKQKRKIGFF